ncbi:hypothetical protein GN156_06610 [bacterium LRH843]|nr:hypothetical protein [bacterium LRH843]
MDLLNDDNLKKSIKKQRNQFNILSGDSTSGHGGFGVGVMNLDNLTPIFVCPEDEEAFIDMGALHARSIVEKRIKFLPNKEEVPNGKLYWLVWVVIEYKDNKPYYAGVTGCEMTVDPAIRRGYKNLPDHVNKMDKALKGHVIVDQMDDKSKELLATFLISHNEQMWLHSEKTLHDALQPKNEG